jgi:anti-sigma factor RsiW
VQHLEREALQLYLAGALDLPACEAMAQHLAECPRCSDRLAELAADDAGLTAALCLSDAERAWVESQDLTAPVLRRITPRLSVPLLIGCVMLLPGIWAFNLIVGLGAGWLAGQSTFGLLINFGRTLGPVLLRFALWLAQGGLLTRLWPLLILGAVLGFWYLNHQKETNDYA